MDEETADYPPHPPRCCDCRHALVARDNQSVDLWFCLHKDADRDGTHHAATLCTVNRRTRHGICGSEARLFEPNALDATGFTADLWARVPR